MQATSKAKVYVGGKLVGEFAVPVTASKKTLNDTHVFTIQPDKELKWKPMFCVKKMAGCFCNVDDVVDQANNKDHSV
jgi:hypothetical protein